MPLPEEASAAEANQAGVTPSQVRQQRVVPPPPLPQSRPAPSAPTSTQGPNYGSVGPGAGGFTGMDATFSERLRAMVAASGGRLSIVSGFRSEQEQSRLWDQALKQYGSAAEARKWVAPPGQSNHNKGIAADLGGDIAWAHAHASEFGLYFPMSWEPWHIEPLGSRGGKGVGAAPTTEEPGAWAGPRATKSGYTSPRQGYSLNEDTGTVDPRKSVDYQLNSFMALLGDPAFILGGPAQLPSYFTSMPNGTA